MNDNVLQLRVNNVHYIDFSGNLPEICELSSAYPIDYSEGRFGEDWIVFDTLDEAKEFLTMYHAARFALQKTLAHLH